MVEVPGPGDPDAADMFRSDQPLPVIHEREVGGDG